MGSKRVEVGKKFLFSTDFDQTVVLDEKIFFYLQTVKMVKLGGRWGKKFFFINRFRSDRGPGRKKNFEFQTVKMVKLGGVSQERQNYIQEQ